MRHVVLFALSSALLLAACQNDAPAVEDPQPITDTDAGLQACAADDDCPFGQQCIGGICSVGQDTGTDAGGCRSDSDCSPIEACVKDTGQCQKIAGLCLDISDCEEGFFCDLEARRCVPAAVDGGTAADAGCLDGDRLPCGKSKLGECRLGEQVCANGAWGACVGAIDPQQELCNDKDDNCNGSVDEDFDKARDPNNCGACGNRCAYANAVPLCVAGKCEMG
ncbi:MAG: hypothetical protein ACK4N5_09310, partial [Myxococcales bacterium]